MIKKDDTAYLTLESMIDMNPSIAIEELSKVVISFERGEKLASPYKKLSLPEAHLLLSRAYARYVSDEFSRGHKKLDELKKARYHFQEGENKIKRRSKKLNRYVSLAYEAIEDVKMEIS